MNKILLLTFISVFSIYSQSKFQVAIGNTASEEGRSIVQAYDGGYVSAGVILNGQYDIYVVKVSSSGQLLWTKTIGGANSDEAYSIIRTNDSGFAVTGYTTSFGAGGSDIIVVKLSSSGSVQWVKTYGGTLSEYGYSIIQIPDGSYIVAGCGTSGTNVPCIIKLSASGDLVWSKIITATIGSGYINSITLTLEGGYAFTGTNNYAVYSGRLDSAGSLIWSSLYKGSNSLDIGKSIIQTSDSGFAVAANIPTGWNGLTDFYLIKYTKNGFFAWDRYYGNINQGDYVSQIFPSPGGGFYLVGGSNLIVGNNVDVNIVKFSNTGEVLWGRFIGYSGVDAVYAAAKTSDNGYILTGSTNSFGSGNTDMYILKLDSIWNTCGNYRDTLAVTNGTIGNNISNTTTVTNQTLTVTTLMPVAGSSGNLYTNCSLIGVQNNSEEIAGRFSLEQNYPNPFNPVTKIKFSINESSPVKLTIYDALGREVSILVNSDLNSGNYEAEFDGKESPSGIYYYKLTAGKYSDTKKMVLIK